MRAESQFTASVLKRIHEFLNSQPVVIALGDLKPAIDSLESTMKDIGVHRSERDSRARTAVVATGRIRELSRQARFQYLRPVSRAASWLFEDNLELQRGFRDRSRARRPELIVDALRGTADVVVPYKAEFAKAGFADDFASRLTKLADSLEAAIAARSFERGRRARATAGGAQKALGGRKLVRMIDSMVSEVLAKEPGLLAEWRLLLRDNKPRVTPLPTDGETGGGTGSGTGGSSPGTPTGGTPPTPDVTPTTPPASGGAPASLPKAA